MANKVSLSELNVLKGIAIIFVVIVHLHPMLIELSIKHSIHSFRSFMYIFMFASGFLHGLSGVQISSWKEYQKFIVKKFKRLMIPYFVVSAIVFILKYIVGKFVPLLHPIENDFWIHILLNPAKGYATFLWFLYVLFIIFTIFPIATYFIKNIFVLSFVMLAIHFLPLKYNTYFNFDYVVYYLFFFYVGYLYSRSNFQKINLNSTYWFFSLSVCFVTLFMLKDSLIMYLTRFITFRLSIDVIDLFIGLLGLFAFYYLSVLITKMTKGGKYIYYVLEYVGLYSAAIYLLHTIFMSPVNILMIEYLNMNTKIYSFIAFLSILAGLIFPILITRYFISKYENLSLLIFGVRKYPQ